LKLAAAANDWGVVLHRFGEATAQLPQPLKADCGVDTGIDKIIVIEPGTILDRAQAYGRSRRERADHSQPREKLFHLVAYLGRRPSIADLSIHCHGDVKRISYTLPSMHWTIKIKRIPDGFDV